MDGGTVTVVISKTDEGWYQAKFGKDAICGIGSDIPAALNAAAYQFSVLGWQRFEDFQMPEGSDAD